ncbi:MAG: transporter [Burkholderiaceae bacterium]|nr:transporter [Burkholderiaceae bacterium]
MAARMEPLMTARAMAGIAAALFWFGTEVHAQESVVAAKKLAASSAADLAKELANPVAALISVPLQLNYDHDIGPARGGKRWLLNIQPVVPVGLSEDWNLISRTILPVVSQDEVVPGAGSQSGIGDIVQSVFFSPKNPTESGLVWGVGPVLLLPTGSDDLLSAKKWGAGPTGVVLKQQGSWTYGALANHIWSIGGSGSRDINATFVQPFVSYATPTAWSYTLNTESTYDWEYRQWAVPVNAVVAKITRFGDQLVSLGGGVRYWADGPESGPHGWGLRVTLTLLFPR